MTDIIDFALQGGFKYKRGRRIEGGEWNQALPHSRVDRVNAL